jgi:hypothetical protein
MNCCNDPDPENNPITGLKGNLILPIVKHLASCVKVKGDREPF